VAKRHKGPGGRADTRFSPKQLALAAAIEACRGIDGIIHKRDVVAAARDPDNILHGEFEWDEDILVQQALEERAAELIRQCRSIVKLGEKELIFPTYLSHPRAADPGYSKTLVIAQNEGLKKLALEAEIGRIKSAVQRAAALAMVFGLESQFEQILREIAEIEAEVMAAA
jgi:hypothetical protein